MEDRRLIEVKEFSFYYNKEKILDQISLNIESGKFYSILGPNGSGKTTLIKNISKIIDKSKNSIFINGEDIMKISCKDLARTLSVVSQDTGIDANFTVMDIVLMGRNPYISKFSHESSYDFKIAKEAMEFTDVWNLKDKNIQNLSGGERQRVLIARAICQDTKIILLDEPISHLDIRYQIDVLNKLKYLNKRKKITIICILHDINLASVYSDYLILMKNGKIFSIGDSEEVINKKSIKEVYGIDVDIIKDSINNKPHIIPIINNLKYY